MRNAQHPSSDHHGDAPSTARFAFGRRRLFFFLSASTVVCALWFWVLMPAIAAARQRECANKLKQIGIALRAYHEVYGCFPAPYIADANGKPMTSWRAAILPYLIQASMRAWYDDRLPWNAPSNLAPASRMTADINPFRCPRASDRQPPTVANYVMIVDPAAASAGQWKKLDKLMNAPSTIVIVEIADSDIFWTEPRDLSIDEMSLRINDKSEPSISSHHPHGAMVLFADGSSGFLDDSTSPQTVQAMLNAATLPGD